MADYGKAAFRVDEGEWIHTVCNMCFNGCGIRAQVVDGVCVTIEGDPNHPHGWGKICGKGLASMMSTYSLNRLKTPLKRTNPKKGIGVDPKWVEISWEEALDTIAQRFKEIREDNPRKLLVAGIDFQMYIFQSTWGTAFGTDNYWTSGSNYWCGNNVHSHTNMYGGGFFHEPDYEHCKYLLLIGAQYGGLSGTNAVPIANLQAHARARGMKVVVVDPLLVNVAGNADEWIPIRPGTDAAFALAMDNVLVNELGIYDKEFLRDKTNGTYLTIADGHYLRDKETKQPMCWDLAEGKARPFDSIQPENMALEESYEVEGQEVATAFTRLKKHLKQYTPEKMSEISTVPAETVRRIAREWAEAASIGTKITIQGKELPLRPVCCVWSKGPSQHWNAWQTGCAMGLLNQLAGAIECPGGYLTCAAKGPHWGPEPTPDGLMRGHGSINYLAKPYPARTVEPPMTFDLFSLYPVSIHSGPAIEEGILRPEKYKLPYRLEAALIVVSNPMANCSNPERMALILNKIPFIVTITPRLTATTEFADIALPGTTFLEELAPDPNSPGEWILPGLRDWYYTIREPVVKPVGQARQWPEILLDLANRIGMTEDYNLVLNGTFVLRDPYKLDPKKEYTYREISERMMGNMTGADWEDIKKQGGFITKPRKLEEAYHFPFNENKYKCPIYYEWLIDCGKEVEEVTTKLGLEWDVSQFVPLPSWFPCPDYAKRGGEHDLYAINYKLPTHTITATADFPFLAEVGEYRPGAYGIKINSETARRKGLKDGDEVWVESRDGWVDSEDNQRPPGKVKGTLKVVEGLHPDCVAIAGCLGSWALGEKVSKGKGVHFNTLLPYDLKRMGPLGAALDNCILVKVYKA
ncbi:molybdopterin-dependent oxidoreductase [Chloroflexota bacterium]